MENEANLERLLKQQLAAQGRTTHAVRSIAFFISIQASTAFIAAFPLAVGFSSSAPEESSGWIFLGGLILLIGTVVSMVVMNSELSKSRIIATRADFANFDLPEKTTRKPSRFGDDDVDRQSLEIAKANLTPKQFQMWIDAGSPNLKLWLEEGKPSFNFWLVNATRVKL